MASVEELDALGMEARVRVDDLVGCNGLLTDFHRRRLLLVLGGGWMPLAQVVRRAGSRTIPYAVPGLLQELLAHGLADNDPAEGWRLTPAGLQAREAVAALVRAAELVRRRDRPTPPTAPAPPPDPGPPLLLPPPRPGPGRRPAGT